MNRFRALFLFSELSSRGRLSLLLEPFAVALLIAFMPVESQRFAIRAGWEKLRACYLLRLVTPHSKKMEPTGFEPVTSSMPLRRSTN